MHRKQIGAAEWVWFAVKLWTRFSPQEVYELLRLSRIMKLKSGATNVFLFVITVAFRGILLISSNLERDKGDL